MVGVELGVLSLVDVVETVVLRRGWYVVVICSSVSSGYGSQTHACECGLCVGVDETQLTQALLAFIAATLRGLVLDMS